jgi:hypothetical protein
MKHTWTLQGAQMTSELVSARVTPAHSMFDFDAK